MGLPAPARWDLCTALKVLTIFVSEWTQASGLQPASSTRLSRRIAPAVSGQYPGPQTWLWQGDEPPGPPEAKGIRAADRAGGRSHRSQQA